MTIFSRDVNQQGVLVMLDANAVQRIALFFEAAHDSAAQSASYERGPSSAAPSWLRNGLAACVCHRDDPIMCVDFSLVVVSDADAVYQYPISRAFAALAPRSASNCAPGPSC